MKFTSKLVISFGLGMLTLTTACVDPKEKEPEIVDVGADCDTDRLCKEGSTCYAGVCTPECDTADDCQEGLGCSNGICLKCTANNQCREGESCDLLEGLCGLPCGKKNKCADGFYCSTLGSCLPQKEQAGLCTNDEQCASGFCTDGVCCDSRCNGLCETCYQKGTVGTCSAVAAGFQDDTCSAANKVCDGSKKCGCADNFVGDNCNDCTEGHFGSYCNVCTCKNDTCNDGINGDGHCKSCEPGTYGHDCENTVRCVNGTPSEGVNGTGHCTECADNFWGVDCKFAVTCVHGTPSQGLFGNGHCIGECDAGYTGPDCDRATSCLHGIVDDSSSDSRCLSCDTNWTGDNCDACSGTLSGPDCSIEGQCKHGTPNYGVNGDGHCIGLCDGNWSGSNCDICDSTKYKGENCEMEIICGIDEKKCDGNNLLTCFNEIRWDSTPCGDQVCQNGACVAKKCDEGQYYCDSAANKLQQCVNNTLVDVKSCQSGEYCNNSIHDCQSLCGNGVIDKSNNEECDSNEFGDADCASVTGKSEAIGELVCNNCRIDSSSCTVPAICEVGKYECKDTSKVMLCEGSSWTNVATCSGADKYCHVDTATNKFGCYYELDASCSADKCDGTRYLDCVAGIGFATTIVCGTGAEADNPICRADGTRQCYFNDDSCSDGALECGDQNTLECDSNDHWFSTGSCEDSGAKCFDGKCYDYEFECELGGLRCNANNGEKCEAGLWTVDKSCTLGETECVVGAKAVNCETPSIKATGCRTQYLGGGKAYGRIEYGAGTSAADYDGRIVCGDADTSLMNWSKIAVGAVSTEEGKDYEFVSDLPEGVVVGAFCLYEFRNKGTQNWFYCSPDQENYHQPILVGDVKLNDTQVWKYNP